MPSAAPDVDFSLLDFIEGWCGAQTADANGWMAPSQIRIACKLRPGEIASEEFFRLFDCQAMDWLL